MKKTDRSFRSTLSFAAAALLAVGAATAQVATTSAAVQPAFPGTEMIDNTGSYQSEMRACASGETQQDRATCMQEARNAAAEKNRGRLELYGNLQQNAMARCDVHQLGEDRVACRARVLGLGDIEGSVAGGGLIRETGTQLLPDGSVAVVEPDTSAPIATAPNTAIQGNR